MILDPNLHCWEALNNNFVELVEQKNQTPTRQKTVHFQIDSRLTEALLSRKHVDFQIYTVGQTFWEQIDSQGGIDFDPRNFQGGGFFFLHMLPPINSSAYVFPVTTVRAWEIESHESVRYNVTTAAKRPSSFLTKYRRFLPLSYYLTFFFQCLLLYF